MLGQSYKNLEIIVVDNPSPSSAEIALIVSQYSNVKLIQNSVNSGFTGGMNRGLHEASGEYVYLTEDDLIVQDTCISKLVNHQENSPATGLAAPIIYNQRDHTIISAGAELILGPIFYKKMLGEGETDTGQFPQTFSVTAIQGSAIFGRLQLFKRLNGFREDFFMYAEDNELCLRVLKLGLNITVVSQAKVYHLGQTKRADPPEIEFHKTKNFFSLYLLHAPARHLPEFVCRYAVVNTVCAVLGKGPSRPRPLLKALYWVAKNSPALLKDRYRQNMCSN